MYNRLSIRRYSVSTGAYILVVLQELGLQQVGKGVVPHEAYNKVMCYDSPWTGLLTSGDASCHRWTVVGVSSDTSGKVLTMDN